MTLYKFHFPKLLPLDCSQVVQQVVYNALSLLTTEKLVLIFYVVKAFLLLESEFLHSSSQIFLQKFLNSQLFCSSKKPWSRLNVHLVSRCTVIMLPSPISFLIWPLPPLQLRKHWSRFRTSIYPNSTIIPQNLFNLHIYQWWNQRYLFHQSECLLIFFKNLPVIFGLNN